MVLPDENQIESLSAVLQDMSPAGVGFKTSLDLPKETRFVSSDLFAQVMSSIGKIEFYLEVMWCRGNSLFGFRCGAAYKFPDELEQDNFSRILNQLQIKRLAWYCHKHLPVS